MATLTLDTFHPDAMAESELWEFWKEYHRCARKKALAFLGKETEGQKGASRIVQTMACYAFNKAVAMSRRVKGDVTAAACYEHAADLSYERIPPEFRW